MHGLECYQRDERVMLNVNGLCTGDNTRNDYLIRLCLRLGGRQVILQFIVGGGS